MQQLTPGDSQMLFIETPEAPNHIAPLSIYDPSTAPNGTVSHTGILNNLVSRLHLAPTFRKKLVYVPFNIDEPYWVDDPKFDIEFHVRHIALPKPGDWRQLCILTARLISRPLDLNRAPWEMYIIEGLDNIEGIPKGCFAVLFKIHHSMVDGKAGASIITALHDLEPLPAPTGKNNSQLKKWRPERLPSTALLTANGMRRLMFKPGHFLRVALRSAPDMIRNRKLRKIKVPFRVPSTPLNDTLTPHRVFDALFFDLAEVKSLRNIVPGCTVNDLAIAIVSGGLHHYLKDKHDLPNDSLIASVPISTRSAADADTKQGNELIVQNIPIFTNIADPLERLETISSTMQETKNYVQAIGAGQLSQLSTAIPGRVAGLLMQGITAASRVSGETLISNTIITNVPGVQVPLYMTGAKCILMGGGGPLNGKVGVIHLITSYIDKFSLNYIACRDLLPDPDFYSACMRRSYDELIAARDKIATKSTTAVTKKPTTSKKKVVRKKAVAKKRASKKPTIKKSAKSS